LAELHVEVPVQTFRLGEFRKNHCLLK